MPTEPPVAAPDAPPPSVEGSAERPRPRVLAVAPQPFYEDRGTPIAVQQLVTALAELDYGVDLLTYPVGATPDMPGVRVLRSANPWRIRRVPIGLSGAKILLDVPLVLELRRRLANESYACVHALEESAFPAAMLARRHGVPVIYDMQSSLPEQLACVPPLGLRPVQAALHACERWLWHNVDAVVASAGLGPRVRAAMPSLPVHEWRYAAALAAPAGSAAARDLRRRLDVPEGNRIVLYSGTFEPYQGLPLLLDALPRVQARVPTVTFVLVGATDDAVVGLGRQHAAAIAAGALRIVARQPRAEVPTFLAAADLLVSTRSVGHNLPLKIFDYLAAGRPIVATDIPAHRAVLDDRCAVLVQPTAGAIAAAIVDLLHDPQRAARLAREGQARGAARHGWASFVESVAELYARVLSSGPGVLRNGRRGPVPLRVNGAR